MIINDGNYKGRPKIVWNAFSSIFALVMYITNYETIYENEKWDDYD